MIEQSDRSRGLLMPGSKDPDDAIVVPHSKD